MKIKQVCEGTGLNDRAICYYIDEGLLQPEFTENYMGRHTFIFSDSDVRLLTHVAPFEEPQGWYEFSLVALNEKDNRTRRFASCCMENEGHTPYFLQLD